MLELESYEGNENIGDIFSFYIEEIFISAILIKMIKYDPKYRAYIHFMFFEKKNIKNLNKSFN